MSVVERNNVRVSGAEDGRPLLFVHGFGCDQRMWDHVAPAFEDDHRVVLLDQVGAGGSDLSAWSPERYESLHGYARDLVEVCEELDLRDVVLVGHSVSAMTGALATIAAPERFAALVMVGASPRYVDDPEAGYVGGFGRADIEGLLEQMDDNYLGWSSAITPVIMGEGNDHTALEQSFCATDPTIARHFARVTFLSDNRDDLGDVPVPTLVLQVAVDALAPREVGAFVHERLPESELVYLDTVGHCPHMSAPDDTVAAIRKFLASHVPAAGP